MLTLIQALVYLLRTKISVSYFHALTCGRGEFQRLHDLQHSKLFLGSRHILVRVGFVDVVTRLRLLIQREGTFIMGNAGINAT